MLAQLPVQHGAADAEVGGDLFGDRAVPDPLGGSGAGGPVQLRGAPGGQPAGLLACDEDRYRILSKSVRGGRSPVPGGRLVIRYRPSRLIVGWPSGVSRATDSPHCCAGLLACPTCGHNPPPGTRQCSNARTSPSSGCTPTVTASPKPGTAWYASRTGPSSTSAAPAAATAPWSPGSRPNSAPSSPRQRWTGCTPAAGNFTPNRYADYK
jgi:hypothetical protein